MEKIIATIQQFTGLAPITQEKIFTSLVTGLLLWLFHKLLLRFTASLKKIDSPTPQFKRTSRSIFQVILLLILWQIWLPGMEAIATYLGLLSAGIAVALREPVSNLFAWAFIIWQRPFEIGNRIQIGEFAGEVLEQRLFGFSLLEIGNWVATDHFTGRVIHIPNSIVFTDPLANYDKESPQIWNEIPVLITFESDWKTAKAILQQIADQQANNGAGTMRTEIEKQISNYAIAMPNFAPEVFTSVEDSGVLLTIRYLCGARQRRASAEQIWEALLEQFAQHPDIELAYPTQRITLDPK